MRTQFANAHPLLASLTSPTAHHVNGTTKLVGACVAFILILRCSITFSVYAFKLDNKNKYYCTTPYCYKKMGWLGYFYFILVLRYYISHKCLDKTSKYYLNGARLFYSVLICCSTQFFHC